MNSRTQAIRYGVAISLGILTALLAKPGTAAAWGCENNACNLGSKNCEVTDYPVSCVETLDEAGCKTTSCQVN
jgi:hypothetical protein